MNKIFILASLLLVTISCSKETTETTEPTESNTETVISLTASLKDTETRVSANTDSDDSWTFEWEETDRLGGWYIGFDEVYLFTISVFDTQSPTFSGTISAPDEVDYRFISPYAEVGYDASEGSDDILTIEIKSQTGDLAHTFLVSDKVSSSDIISGKITNLYMEHLCGFMAVDVFISDYIDGMTYTLTKVSYSSTDEIIPTYAKLDMSKDDIDDIIYYTTSGTITSTISEKFEPVEYNGTDYLQAITGLNIIPFEVAYGQSATIALTIELSDEAGEVLKTTTSSVTLTNTNEESISFARGTHNFTYLTVDGSYETKITGATITGWNDKDGGDIPTT